MSVLLLLAQTSATATQATSSLNSWAGLWAFLNSPVGFLIVGSVLLPLLKWILTRNPQWMNFFVDKKPLLMDAVRFAEKVIPDGTPNKAAARADAALKWIITQDEEVAKAKKATVRLALDAAHAEVEKKNGNGKNGNDEVKKEGNPP